MELDFDTVVAYLVALLVGLYLGIYAGIVSPLTEVWPYPLRTVMREWWARLAQNVIALVVEKAFIIEVTGDKFEPNESAVILLNHQGMVDYAVIQALASHAGIHTNCYFFVHNTLARLPTFPLLWKHFRRQGNWTASDKSLEDLFRELPWRSAIGSPKWVVMYPEVTAFSQVDNQSHQVLCYAAGAQPLHHLLYPRFSSLVVPFDYLRGSPTTVVYDLTVKYQRVTNKHAYEVPTINDFLVSSKNWKVTVAFKKHRIGDLPRSRKRFEKWIERQWYKKDKQIAKMVSRAARS